MIPCAQIVLILHIISLPLAFQFQDDAMDEITTTTPPNKSSSHVKAMLTPHQRDSGVIQILFPDAPDSYPVCYPETFLQNSEAVKLIHVLCKQLGLVTFGSRYKEMYPKKRPGVMSTSAQCTGLEDQVSQCPWKNIKSERCREVLATRCTSCNHKMVASNGTIHNPGFPYVYLYSMTCEWTVEVPGDLDIDLTFEQFALPRQKNHECESYIELAYGNRKTLTHQRLCPSDLPVSFHITYRSVRIRFSSGKYRQEYEEQQSHYGFKIVFRAVKPDRPGYQPLKVLLICVLTSVVVLVLFCFCCRHVRRKPRRPALPLPPTQDQIQAAFEFQRCALQAPQNEPKSLDFSIYQSDGSSMDSNIARWRSNTDLPVTSALAPLGPDNRRMISIASTPRTALSKSRRPLSEGKPRRLNQLRTKLVARFSSTSSHNLSDISVFFPASERRSYSRLSCEDIPLHSVVSQDSQKSVTEESSSSNGVPNIVIEFVK